ncbi:MAG: hypothetical protein ACYCX4_06945 [Bacillota bacterium]
MSKRHAYADQGWYQVIHMQSKDLVTEIVYVRVGNLYIIHQVANRNYPDGKVFCDQELVSGLLKELRKQKVSSFVIDEYLANKQ